MSVILILWDKGKNFFLLLSGSLIIWVVLSKNNWQNKIFLASCLLERKKKLPLQRFAQIIKTLCCGWNMIKRGG